MRAKEGRDDIEGFRLTQLARHTQHLKFRFNIEAIAGFDLDSGDTFGEKRLQPTVCRSKQFVFRCGARHFHSRGNAAACFGDFGIGNASETHLELMGAIAAINDMSVAIDEAGRNQSALAINRPSALGLGARTHPGDGAAFHQNGAIRDQTIGCAAIHGGNPAIGKEMHGSTCIRLSIQYRRGHGRTQAPFRLRAHIRWLG